MKRVFFGQNDLRFLYFKYKDSTYYLISIVAGVILVCVILIFTVIIPQMQTYFSIRDEVIALRSKIGTINGNINFMNNLDKSELTSQLQTTTQALPSEKNLLSAIDAISYSAIKSGVTINDYNISNDKANSQAADKSVDLSVSVNGSIDRVTYFVKEVTTKVPIAEVTSIDTNESNTTVGLKFYYKPFPKIAFNDDQPLTPVTDSKKELIRQLSSWRLSNGVPSNASQSAVPLFGQ